MSKARTQRKMKRARTSIRLETEKFNRAVHERMAQLRLSNADAILTIALELNRRIMLAWPVDTGRSRAAWSILLERHGVPIPNYSGSQGGGANADPAAEQEGKSLGDAEEELEGPLPKIVLINGVEYSPFLELGHSGQAPKGAIRISMRQMRQAMRQTMKKKIKP